MLYKKIIQAIGFQPKENAKDIYIKKYSSGYSIEVYTQKYGDYLASITI